MTASGKIDVMSDAEIKQRQQAPRKHGVRSFQVRGEEALDESGRSRLEELKEQVQDREGVIALMQERAANAVMVTELVMSFVAKELKAGKSLSSIPIFRSLPAYMNTAGRALKDLANEMPEKKGIADAEVVLNAVKNAEEN